MIGQHSFVIVVERSVCIRTGTRVHTCWRNLTTSSKRKKFPRATSKLRNAVQDSCFIWLQKLAKFDDAFSGKFHYKIEIKRLFCVVACEVCSNHPDPQHTYCMSSYFGSSIVGLLILMGTNVQERSVDIETNAA